MEGREKGHCSRPSNSQNTVEGLYENIGFTGRNEGRREMKRFKFLILNTNFIVFDRKGSYLIFLTNSYF